MKNQALSILRSALPLGLLVLTLPASADEPPRALNRTGELLEIEAGAFGRFFDDGALATDQPILVLSVRGSDTESREIVPTTEDAAEEVAPLLVHDTRSDRSTILWERRDEDGTSIRYIQRMSDGSWSEVRTLAGTENVGADFYRSMTRESLLLTLPDSRMVEARRELIHFVWWQDDQLRYASVLSVGGKALAQVYEADLFSLLDLDNVMSPVVPSDRLRDTISVAGLASGALSTTLIDPQTDRLLTIELKTSYIEIRSFVDQIRADILQILDPNAPLTDEIRAEMIASGIRAEMIASGLEIGMADQLLDFVSTTGEEFTAGFFQLNDQATATEWMDALSDLLLQLLQSIYATAQGSIQIDINGPTDVLATSVFDRPAPITGDGATRAYVAPGGRLALIGWYEQESDTVFWIESTDDPESPWTDPRALLLDDRVGLDQADALLRRRVQ